MAFKHTTTSLELVKNGSPTTPSSGHVGLYFNNSDGRLYQINSSGVSFPLGTQILTKDEFGLESNLYASSLEFPRGTITDLGSNVTRLNVAPNYRIRRSMMLAAVSASAATSYAMNFSSAAASTTGATQVDGYYVTIATTAVAGNLAGYTFNTSQQHTSTAYNPIFEAVIRTGATITSSRLWIGLINGTPPNSDTLGINGVAFRFNGTGGWVPVAYNGTQTTGSAIGTVAVSTFYRLRIRVVSATSTAYFSVNDGTEQVVSTNVPTGPVNLTAVVIATAASARTLLFGRMVCECD